MSLESDLQVRWQRLHKAQGQRDLIAQQLAEVEQQRAIHTAQMAVHCQLVDLMRQVRTEQLERLLRGLSQFLTDGLQEVYEEGEVRLEATESAVSLQVQQGAVNGGLEHCYGGGVADWIAQLLRIACLLLLPQTRRLLVLDESFRFVSDDRVAALGDVLVQLCQEWDMQMILVTHQELFKSGTLSVQETGSYGPTG